MSITARRLRDSFAYRTRGIRGRLWPYVRVRGVWIRVDDRLGVSDCDRLFRKVHEAHELEVLSSALAPTDTVMEIGAGIGLLTAYCAKRIGSSRVTAYEANTDLRDRVEGFHASNNVRPTVHWGAVGPRGGEVDFYLADAWFNSSTVATAERKVRVRMFDINVEIMRVRPSFIIVDVEGAEEALCRATTFPGVDKVMIEIHPDIIGKDGVARTRDILAEHFALRRNLGDIWLYARRGSNP